MKNFRPSKEDILDAVNRTTVDLIDYNLKVLFCGINPGIWSGARFSSSATASRVFANGLRQGPTSFLGKEYIEGGKRVIKSIEKYKPRNLAVLGIGAFRTAFAKPAVQLGLQDEKMGETRVWLLPNTSGLNAHYQLPDLVKLFSELKQNL